MSIYLGVDQALRKLGICVLENDTITLSERLTIPAELHGPERLSHIRRVVCNTLARYKGRITAGAYEGQALMAVGDIDQLGNVGGIVALLMVDDLGINPKKIYKVPPMSLKKFVTGKSNASKDLMMRTSHEEWGFDFLNDDACDAHGLARFAQEVVEPRSTTRFRIEAVHNVLTPKKRKPRIKKLFKNSI